MYLKYIELNFGFVFYTFINKFWEEFLNIKNILMNKLSFTECVLKVLQYFLNSSKKKKKLNFLKINWSQNTFEL